MDKARLGKYSSHAVISGGLFHFMNSSKGAAVLVNGVRIPISVFGAGVGVASTFVNDIAHSYVLPHLSADARINFIESHMLSPVVSGGVYYLATKLLTPGVADSVPMLELAGIGAISELVSQFTYETLLLPWINKDAIADL